MNIDWKEVQSRLAAAQASAIQNASPSAEEARKILKARAELLAREPPGVEINGDPMELLEFRLAEEIYGIELAYVREVAPLKALTPVPGTPPFVLGIIGVRGQVFSVIDLKKFFELPESGLSDLNKVIVAQHNGMEFGILADAVIGIHSLPVREMQPPLPTLTGIRQEYLMGITPGGVVALDGAKLLADSSLIVRQQPEARS